MKAIFMDRVGTAKGTQHAIKPGGTEGILVRNASLRLDRHSNQRFRGIQRGCITRLRIVLHPQERLPSSF